MFCIQSLSVHPQNTHCCPIGLDPLSLLPPTAFSLLSPSLYISNSNQISSSCSRANPKLLCLHHNMHPSLLSFLLRFLLLLLFLFTLYPNNHSTRPHKPVQLPFADKQLELQPSQRPDVRDEVYRGRCLLSVWPNPAQIPPLLLHEEKNPALAHVWLHKQSDKAVIPALNFTKASPASTASPSHSGETKKKRKKEREKRGKTERERGQFPAQREKKTFAATFSVSLPPFG